MDKKQVWNEIVNHFTPQEIYYVGVAECIEYHIGDIEEKIFLLKEILDNPIPPKIEDPQGEYDFGIILDDFTEFDEFFKNEEIKIPIEEIPIDEEKIKKEIMGYIQEFSKWNDIKRIFDGDPNFFESINEFGKPLEIFD